MRYNPRSVDYVTIHAVDITSVQTKGPLLVEATVKITAVVSVDEIDDRASYGDDDEKALEAAIKGTLEVKVQ